MGEEYITVSNLNYYLKKKFDTDQNLKKVYLKGEISNFKGANRGNYYFTLKDDKSQVNAILFGGYAKKVKFNIENGLKVLVRGFVGVYPAYGKYQIYINKMTEDGLGDLHVAYEQLKKKLKAEGLFDKQFKKSIPKFPKKIGVITSSNGAAIKDIVSTIEKRWPLCEILIFSSLVQGDGAPLNIVNQIKFSENFDLDTLIIGRGGGSIEDLWAFNEEIVARAIYNAKTPIISAIGHETDYTIADFVSDERALTPTDAANIAVPDINIIKNQLNELNLKIQNLVNNQIKSYSQKLDSLTHRNIFFSPDRIYQYQEMNLDKLIKDLEIFTNNLINDRESRLNQIKNSYSLKNPYFILDKKLDKFNQLINRLELVSPQGVYETKEMKLYTLTNKLDYLTQRIITANESRLNQIKNSYGLKNPYIITDKKLDKLNQLTTKLELVSPEGIYESQVLSLNKLIDKLHYSYQNIILNKENRFIQVKNSYGLKNPYKITDKKRDKVSQSISKLELLNPLLTLKRGYTLAKIDGKVVSKSKDLKQGDQVDIEFSDGVVNTKVI